MKNNSSIQSDIVCSRLNIRNSTLIRSSAGSPQSIDVSGQLILKESTVGNAFIDVIVNGSVDLDVNVSNCTINGAVINPNGTASVSEMIIKDNVFNNTRGLTEYEPITQSSVSLLVNAGSDIKGSVSTYERDIVSGEWSVAVNNFGPIEISGNAPFYGGFSNMANDSVIVSDPTIKIRQTKFNLLVEGDSTGLDNIGTMEIDVPLLDNKYKFAWLPYTDSGQYSFWKTLGTASRSLNWDSSTDPYPSVYVDRSFGYDTANILKVYLYAEVTSVIGTESSASIDIDIYPH